MKLIARPIDQWPGKLLGDDIYRDWPRFTASWSDTTDLLAREVRQLTRYGREPEVVLQLAVTETDLRLDGWIRASARPAHPGVIVAFESRHGPLRYATDLFRGNSDMPGWQANVRAIALGLEALRKVDRYGISKDGQQYRGWQALPPGQPTEVGPAMTVDEAARLLLYHGDGTGTVALVLGDRRYRDLMYRQAAKRLHPDAGGDPADFRRLQEARKLLEAQCP
jgi:hypothetical protein